jgi:hypothetical protein
MSTVNRRWYAFNGTPGGQKNQLNYFFISEFPNACLTTASNICAVLGVYSIVPSVGSPTIFGTNPRAFTADPKLDSYITQALASSNPAPSALPGQKKYVYVRSFTS